MNEVVPLSEIQPLDIVASPRGLPLSVERVDRDGDLLILRWFRRADYDGHVRVEDGRIFGSFVPSPPDRPIRLVHRPRRLRSVDPSESPPETAAGS